MLKWRDGPVLLGQSAGAMLRWITGEERRALAEDVRRCYALQRTGSGCPVEYLGHEFTDTAGRRLLYLEEWC